MAKRAPKAQKSGDRNGARRAGGNERERMLYLVRRLAAYACAGVDQDVDNPTPCGQCAPCEANQFLREIGDRLDPDLKGRA